MTDKKKSVGTNGAAVFPLVLITGIIIKMAFLGDEKWLWRLLITLPLLLLSFAKKPRSPKQVTRRPSLNRQPRYSFETDQYERLARRQPSHYIRCRIFSRS